MAIPQIQVNAVTRYLGMKIDQEESAIKVLDTELNNLSVSKRVVDIARRFGFRFWSRSWCVVSLF